MTNPKPLVAAQLLRWRDGQAKLSLTAYPRSVMLILTIDPWLPVLRPETGASKVKLRRKCAQFA